ncbi:MAG: ATP-binding protein [Anaerolineales bacterium]|nr:ATP-binding protein [Anaerolineales bacterium]
MTTPTSSTTDPAAADAGDPNCPHCHGLGYLRRERPLGDPDFGRLEPCTCRQAGLRRQVRQQLYSLSRLDWLQHMTFESFQPRGRPNLAAYHQESLELAFLACQHYAHTLDGWLLLQGGYGCGKTHLAAAIANECVSLGVPTLFLTVPDLLDSLRATYDTEDITFEARFDQIRNAQLLVLDDLGTQHATEWAREKLFQILNYRYINHLPVVLTTNLPLDEIDGRLRSRLSDPELVAHVLIQAPDYRRPVDDLGHHELSTLAVHGQQTFGTFSLREQEKLPADDSRNLRKAFDLARKFAEDPSGWLVLTGTYGCGKTHLAAAIANYRASQGFAVMFVPVPDLLDHLRATFSPSSPVSYDRRFDEIRESPLLVLDDLGTQASTAWAQEKLYQILNHRYNKGLPSVITTAMRLDEIDARIRSRMLDNRLCTVFAMTSPSYVEGRPRRPRKR